MASNRELQDAITVASEKLKITANLQGNNLQLAERLKELNAQVTALENIPKEPETQESSTTYEEGAAIAPGTSGEVDGEEFKGSEETEETDDVETKEEVEDENNTTTIESRFQAPVPEVQPREVDFSDLENFEFVVAKGQAVTTRRGILGEGQIVEAKDFYNAESFQAQLKAKVVVVRS